MDVSEKKFQFSTQIFVLNFRIFWFPEKFLKKVYPKKFETVNGITFGFLVYGKFLEIPENNLDFWNFGKLVKVENG